MRNRLWGLILLSFSLVGMTSGILLLTHTFPETSKPVPSITSSCTTLSMSPAVQPRQGTIRATCGNSPAFTRSSADNLATPVFVLGTGYTGVSAVMAGTGECVMGPLLVSGSSLSLAAGGYDYCLSYDTPAASLGSFTLTWSQ